MGPSGWPVEAPGDTLRGIILYWGVSVRWRGGLRGGGLQDLHFLDVPPAPRGGGMEESRGGGESEGPQKIPARIFRGGKIGRAARAGFVYRVAEVWRASRAAFFLYSIIQIRARRGNLARGFPRRGKTGAVHSFLYRAAKVQRRAKRARFSCACFAFGPRWEIPTWTFHGAGKSRRAVRAPDFYIASRKCGGALRVPDCSQCIFLTGSGGKSVA